MPVVIPLYLYTLIIEFIPKTKLSIPVIIGKEHQTEKYGKSIRHRERIGRYYDPSRK